MIKVGITGGIGSGKSTVCQIFQTLGIPIYQADDRAKYLMQNDSELKGRIMSEFGEKSYANGELNRPYLAKMIFSESNQTAKMNALVHPVVARDFANWIDKKESAYIIKEAALLIESGSYKNLDFLINVHAPLELRISRIQQRDPQRSLEEIHGIINKQISEEERERLASVTINNDEQSLLIPQVLTIHQQILKVN